ncbi:MAG: lysine--tRNA ligase [Patescibacteria group bacterium]
MSEQSQKQAPDINDERAMRVQKLHDLRAHGIDPYPARSNRSDIIVDAQKKSHGASVTIAGRIMTKRDMGKITFCHLSDETGTMQIALRKDILPVDSYDLFIQKIDTADIIEVSGERFATKAGEESILVHSWRLLTKALRPLPDKFHGLHDEETRLRKRYLDILANPELKDLFQKKSAFWHHMRTFLLEEGFLEVETPVLETTAGGADATPFATHHNALDMDVYLRISMGELWQKRLMVAGFEKTFEIGRQFRNEGMSREHLQDYTQMEFYWAYADYEKGMALVERMFQYVIHQTFGTLTFSIGNFPDIDLSGSWKRIDFTDEVKKQTGVDIASADERTMQKKLDGLHITYEATGGRARLIDALWKYCRKNIKGPVFLVHHPVDISPLAKRHTTLHNATERYQIIIAGSEVGNGYSELNDPLDQAERFREQAKLREAGDAEAQMEDTDFVEALEHGMPPTTGFGVSERLFAFLMDKPVRECVVFPLMRPSHGVQTLSESKQTDHSEQGDKDDILPMNRDAAWELVKKYNMEQNEFNHYLESESVMRTLAKRLNKDVEYWGMLGLLHDLDWHMTKENDALHITKTPDILRANGFSEHFIAIIISHGYGTHCGGGELQNKKRSRDVEHALAASETVTGLVHAAALMKPDKIASLTGASVKKKFKDKKFAAKVNREFILECEKIGVPLDEFLELAVEAIRGIASEVGLA